MNSKLTSSLIFLIVLAGTSPLAFHIQSVEASGNIYIRADGSIEGTTDISTVDNVTYTFTDNIFNQSIIVEKDNILIDGAGYTLQGTRRGNGFSLNNTSNVIIKNMNIVLFNYGICLNSTKHSVLSRNNMTQNEFAIVLFSSSNNTISGNNIENSGCHGIVINDSSERNNILRNNITGCTAGIPCSGSHNNIIENNLSYNHAAVSLGSNNTLSGNNITNNTGSGVYAYLNNVIFQNIISFNEEGVAFGSLLPSLGNVIFENNITNNEQGIYIASSLSNLIYHNNFINNSQQVSSGFFTSKENVWDDGYPSGGNYWSNYNGSDSNSDGIGETQYIIDENNRDRYPLMNLWTPPAHELVVSLDASSAIMLGDSSLLNATITNQGVNDEADVELSLFINGTKADSSTIPFLKAGYSHTLSYSWTPTIEGTYNVTAYAYPVPGEVSLENNQGTEFMKVLEMHVGIKAGDWIKCDYAISGWTSGTPYPEWLKVEILSVEGTTAIMMVTMHMSDGTEQSDFLAVDVAKGGEAFQGLSGFVIPANSTIGDSVYITGYGWLAISGETTKSCAGTRRTTVYASFSQYGTELTYYWDKETGIMVEASTISGGVTGTAKATETNMWMAVASPLWMQWWLWTIVAVIIVAMAGIVYYLKKRKPSTPTTISSTESIE